MMKRIRLVLPEGALEAEIGTGEGPERIADLAYRMLGLSEAAANAAAARRARDGAAVSCAKGCGDCCRQLVPLSAPEAIIVAEVVESLPEPDGSRVRANFESAVDCVERSGLGSDLEKLAAGAADTPEMVDITRRYFELGIPCPFLHDQSCAIHPARPSRCREYLVCSPPERCRDPYTGNIDRVQVPVRLSEALALLWAAITKTPPRIVALTMALRWVGEHPDSRFLAADPGAVIDSVVGYLQSRA